MFRRSGPLPKDAERRRPRESLVEPKRPVEPGHLLLDDPVGLRHFVEEMDEAIDAEVRKHATGSLTYALTRVTGKKLGQQAKPWLDAYEGK